MSKEHKVPEGHPAIDWSKWEPAGDSDVRSPCPMINALANHHILPHSGRDITKPLLIDVLTRSINLSSTIANVFASVAVTSNPSNGSNPLSVPDTATFSLDQLAKHGLIEHDVSLSRNDLALGQHNNHSFNKDIWEAVMDSYGSDTETSFESVSRARWQRVGSCKAAHMSAGGKVGYGVKEFVLSYGESALFLGILGSPKEGVIPLEWLRVLFEQERVPYKEGWRPLKTPLTQTDMNHMIFELIKANEHKTAEAQDVGLGTMHAVTEAVTSVLPTHCTLM